MREGDPLVIPPGTEVRGFLIEQELGAGGFGTVFRARRGERLYALKFIRRKDAGGWARREVESLLRVSHRNVVGFEGCGFWPDDTREYLVVIMVYVEGQRLDRWAEEENPDARQVAQTDVPPPEGFFVGLYRGASVTMSVVSTLWALPLTSPLA